MHRPYHPLRRIRRRPHCRGHRCARRCLLQAAGCFCSALLSTAFSHFSKPPSVCCSHILDLLRASLALAGALNSRAQAAAPTRSRPPPPARLPPPRSPLLPRPPPPPPVRPARTESTPARSWLRWRAARPRQAGRLWPPRRPGVAATPPAAVASPTKTGLTPPVSCQRSENPDQLIGPGSHAKLRGRSAVCCLPPAENAVWSRALLVSAAETMRGCRRRRQIPDQEHARRALVLAPRRERREVQFHHRCMGGTSAVSLCAQPFLPRPSAQRAAAACV